MIRHVPPFPTRPAPGTDWRLCTAPAHVYAVSNGTGLRRPEWTVHFTVDGKRQSLSRKRFLKYAFEEATP